MSSSVPPGQTDYRDGGSHSVWAGRPIFPAAEAQSGTIYTGARARPRRRRRAPHGAPGARRRAASLQSSLERALRVPHVSLAATGAVALDLSTGATVYSRNATLPLIPASNEKLAVTYAALTALGPGFTIETDVLGDGQALGATWHGDLVLKGYGDPTLSSADLTALARQVRADGITRVTGRVLGDESWFDARRTARGWKAAVLHHRVSPALRAHRRPGSRRPLHVARPGPRRCAALPFGARAGRRPRRGRRRPRLGRRRRRAARVGRLAGARRDRALDGPRERQLHGRDARQGARRRAVRPGHDGGRCRASSRVFSRRPASRSRVSASSTARDSRSSTG